MTYDYGTIGAAGLQFFGKVSSTACHEMKNVLAIINENNGLLEDMQFAAQKGIPIDGERLARTCQNLYKQVQRADDLLKNMSRFAHSVDQFQARINLYDCCCLVANLAHRQAAMRRVTLEIQPPSEPLLISNNPFLLKNLLWLSLLEAIRQSAGDTTIAVTMRREEAVLLVTISGLLTQPVAASEELPAPLPDILASFPAQLEVNWQQQQFQIHLPIN